MQARCTLHEDVQLARKTVYVLLVKWRVIVTSACGQTEHFYVPRELKFHH